MDAIGLVLLTVDDFLVAAVVVLVVSWGVLHYSCPSDVSCLSLSNATSYYPLGFAAAPASLQVGPGMSVACSHTQVVWLLCDWEVYSVG